MTAQVLEVRLRRCASDLLFHVPREGGGMHEIAFNFVPLPPQSLEPLTRDGSGLDLLARVAVDELEPRKVIPDQFQRVIVVLRRNTRGAGPSFRHSRLPKQVRGKDLVERMIKDASP